MAAYLAYNMAASKTRVEDFDILETHDAFTISDVQTYEEPSAAAQGRGHEFIDSGDAYSRAGCRRICRVGLTGPCTRSARPASSAVELLWQLPGQYDKFHGVPRCGRATARRNRRLEESPSPSTQARLHHFPMRDRQPRNLRHFGDPNGREYGDKSNKVTR